LKTFEVWNGNSPTFKQNLSRNDPIPNKYFQRKNKLDCSIAPQFRGVVAVVRQYISPMPH